MGVGVVKSENIFQCSNKYVICFVFFPSKTKPSRGFGRLWVLKANNEEINADIVRRRQW